MARLRSSSIMTALLTRDDLRRIPAVPGDVRYRYGRDPEQFADLYLPENSAVLAPVVVLLHGGCWRSRVGLTYFGPFARALANAGLAVWNLEYRRLGNGGGWPMTFLDVAKGTDFLRQVAREHPLDLTRIIAVGHSAGGHLALWLTGRERLPDSSPLYSQTPLALHGVVSLAGIPDLGRAAHEGICQDAPRDLLGGAPDEMGGRYTQASPVNFLPLGMPQVIFNGGRDDIVPLTYARSYVRTARAKGDDVRFEPLPEAGHFEPVVVDSPVWPLVKGAVLGLATPSGHVPSQSPVNG